MVHHRLLATCVLGQVLSVHGITSPAILDDDMQLLQRSVTLSSSMLKTMHESFQGEASSGSHPSEAALHTMASLDTNQDNFADRDEIAAFALQRGQPAPDESEFFALDANHDGRLDVAELQVALGLPAGGGPVTAQESEATQEGSLAQPSSPRSVDKKQSVAVAAPKAQIAASLISTQLQIQASKEREAQRLETLVLELRANASSMAREVSRSVMDAGARAAANATEGLLSQLKLLEDEAQQAEVQAAELHARSTAQLRAANDFMVVANEAMNTRA